MGRSLIAIQVFPSFFLLCTSTLDLNVLCPANSSFVSKHITSAEESLGVLLFKWETGESYDGPCVPLVLPQSQVGGNISICASQHTQIWFVAASTTLTGSCRIIEFDFLFGENEVSYNCNAKNSSLDLNLIPVVPLVNYCNMTYIPYICNCGHQEEEKTLPQTNSRGQYLISHANIDTYFISVVLVIFVLISMSKRTADEAKKNLVHKKVLKKWYQHKEFEARKRKQSLRQAKRKIQALTRKKNILSRKARRNYRFFWVENSQKKALTVKKKKLQAVISRREKELKEALAVNSDLREQLSEITNQHNESNKLEAKKEDETETSLIAAGEKWTKLMEANSGAEERLEMKLKAAVEELQCKEEKLKLNVELAHSEITDYKQKLNDLLPVSDANAVSAETPPSMYQRVVAVLKPKKGQALSGPPHHGQQQTVSAWDLSFKKS